MLTLWLLSFILLCTHLVSCGSNLKRDSQNTRKCSSPATWTRTDNNDKYSYLFLHDKKENQNSARLACQDHGGSLVSVLDMAENEFIHHEFMKRCPHVGILWIGLVKLGPLETPVNYQHNYFWLDETKYKHWDDIWMAGQPSDPEGRYNCVVMNATYNYNTMAKWRVYDCDELLMAYVCKKQNPENGKTFKSRFVVFLTLFVISMLIIIYGIYVIFNNWQNINMRPSLKKNEYKGVPPAPKGGGNQQQRSDSGRPPPSQSNTPGGQIKLPPGFGSGRPSHNQQQPDGDGTQVPLQAFQTGRHNQQRSDGDGAQQTSAGNQSAASISPRHETWTITGNLIDCATQPV